MKKPPFQVAPSKSRSLLRHPKDNHLCQNDKSFRTLDDRLERGLPFHAPHGLHTEEDFAEWINHEMEGDQS